MAAVSEKEKAIIAPETRPYSAVNKGYTPMRNGDIIVAKITPCFENGKVAVVDIGHEYPNVANVFWQTAYKMLFSRRF